MPIRVLVVDDSAVIRGLMSKTLSADPAIVIVGAAGNGSMAITMAKDLQPDIVVLDIEMPVMDGMAALPELLKISPNSKVIMASTLSLRNAAISMQALELGAVDCLAKPSAKSGTEAEAFHRELREKVKAWARGYATPEVIEEPAPAPAEVAATAPAPLAAPVSVSAPSEAPVVQTLASLSEALNPSGITALAIASSTGGPQALMSLFEQLRGTLQAIPIFITQHMPPTFTTILAEHLGKHGNRTCLEAKGGEVVQPGCVYLAPGDYHMVAEKNPVGGVTLRINQDAPENFCRPAADPMLRSLSKIYGAQLAVAVLTGMGQDGMQGSKEVVKNGGSVIAQHEASCVVYGMPKAIVENRLCKAILPIQEMGGYLIRQIDGRRG